MQIVFDFIAGDIPFDEFWDTYCADPKIGEWLDSIADFSQEPPPQICKDIMLLGIYRTVQSDYHGHISQFISADYAAMKNGLMDAKAFSDDRICSRWRLLSTTAMTAASRSRA